MDEQLKILDTIKTKATQAAQDGQSLKTRTMLQADINRLMEELDNIANTNFKFDSVVISTSVGTGLGALAEEINRNADKTGIRATFDVKSVGAYAIKAGNTSQDFAINGVVIGQINYNDGDNNGQLISAINAVKDTTGIEASKDENGKLVLTSRDGRVFFEIFF